MPGDIGGQILALTGQSAPGVLLSEADIDFFRRVPYTRKKAHKWLSNLRQDRAIFITQDINTNENIDRGRGPKEKRTIQHSDN